MRPWNTQLDYARHRQNTLRRESCFRQQLCQCRCVEVLANRRPANAADLAALTMSHLRGACPEDPGRSYLRLASVLERGLVQPARETPSRKKRAAMRYCQTCRHGCPDCTSTREPEGRYADAKRSDIRVSYGGLNVPVEIKKDSHRDLWSAIRTQLIAKYTRDPGTGGYGIYVVFWFGEGKAPDAGNRYGSRNDPAELEERLRATLTTRGGAPGLDLRHRCFAARAANAALTKPSTARLRNHGPTGAPDRPRRTGQKESTAPVKASILRKRCGADPFRPAGKAARAQ